MRREIQVEIPITVSILCALAIIILTALLIGCSMQRKQAEVPGCPLADVVVRDGCYSRQEKKELVVVCKDVIYHYKCMGKK